MAFKEFLSGLGNFGLAGQQPGLQGLLGNPLFSMGLALLQPRESTGEALMNALQAGQQTTQFGQNQRAREQSAIDQQDLRELRKLKLKQVEQATAGEEARRRNLQKLFGNAASSPEQIYQGLASTGDPELINLALKFRPEIEKIPQITPFQQRSLDLQERKLNLKSARPSSVARPRRLTQSEKLAQELQGVDLTSLNREELNTALAKVGQKIGDASLIKQGVKEPVMKKEPSKKDNLNQDLIMYRKLVPMEHIPQGEFLARADLMRAMERDFPERNLSTLERQKFLAGSADEFSSILTSFNAPTTQSQSPQRALPQAPVPQQLGPQQLIPQQQAAQLQIPQQQGPAANLNPQQRQKLEAILQNPNIPQAKKQELLMKLGIR